MSLIDQTLGAELAGVFGSTLLFGVAIVQSYNFFASDAQNPIRLKLLVGISFIFETLHMVFLWAYIYNITVTHYGNVFALNSIPWVFAASLMVQAVVTALVQVFFTYRIYIVSGRWWLVLPLYMLTLFELGITAVIVAFATKSSGFLDFKAKYNYLVYIVLICAVVIDVINTTLLCSYLKALDSGFDRTRRVVNRVALYAVETGMLTTATIVITLALWITKPSSGLWVASLNICSKLYSNSLLGALNSRRKMRSVLASSSAGVTLPSFRVSRSNGANGTTEGGIIPLEPISFTKHTDVGSGFAVTTTNREAPGPYELERSAYDLEKSPPTTPTAQGHCHDVTYDDDQEIYERSHKKANDLNDDLIIERGTAV